MTDHVTYALPFSPLGDLFHAIHIRQQLKNIFDYCREKVKTLILNPAETLVSHKED